MHWITIEPGCEMPEEGERVLVVAERGPWQEAVYSEGYFACAPDGEEIADVIRWLRVVSPT